MFTAMGFSLKLVSAQDSQRSDAGYCFQLARKAYQEKKYSFFVDNMKLALALRPTHQTYIYYQAVKKAEALSLLSRATNLGLVYNLDGKADFDAIRGADEFKSILRKIESNKA